MPITQEELVSAVLPDLEAVCAPTPIAEMEEALRAGRQGEGEGAGERRVHGILEELGIGHGKGEMDVSGSGGAGGEGGADRLCGLRRIPPFLGEKAEEAAPWPGALRGMLMARQRRCRTPEASEPLGEGRVPASPMRAGATPA